MEQLKAPESGSKYREIVDRLAALEPGNCLSIYTVLPSTLRTALWRLGKAKGIKIKTEFDEATKIMNVWLVAITPEAVYSDTGSNR